MSDRVIPNNAWTEIAPGVNILQLTGQTLPLTVRAEPAGREREQIRSDNAKLRAENAELRDRDARQVAEIQRLRELVDAVASRSREPEVDLWRGTR